MAVWGEYVVKLTVFRRLGRWFLDPDIVSNMFLLKEGDGMLEADCTRNVVEAMSWGKVGCARLTLKSAREVRGMVLVDDLQKIYCRMWAWSLLGET